MATGVRRKEILVFVSCFKTVNFTGPNVLLLRSHGLLDHFFFFSVDKHPHINMC